MTKITKTKSGIDKHKINFILDFDDVDSANKFAKED